MLQYIISLNMDTKRSVNSLHGSTTITVNPRPHNDTTTTETIMFQNTTGGITFFMTSIDSGTSIYSEQHETWFIEK